MSTTHLALRRLWFGLAVVAIAAALAACGSSKTSSTTAAAGSTTASASSGGFAARRAALVACLKQHGVTLPNRPPGAGRGFGNGGPPNGAPPNGGPGRGFFFGGGRRLNPKMQAAFRACGSRLGFRGRFAGRLSHQTIEKFVSCVRQHGYNLPSPNFSGQGPVFPPSIRTNAKFQAASRACRSVLVPPGGAGGGSAGGGSA